MTTKILLYKEELLLNDSDRHEYLEKLRELYKNRKTTNTTFGATLWGGKLYQPTQKIASSLTKALMDKGAEVVVEGQENIPDCNCIFALNHQGLLDNFVWIPYTNKHALIVHQAKINRLLMAAQLNTGLITVEKGNRENNANAKRDIITHLLNGHSVVWYPEGTWNLSINRLLLPESHGFIDAARIARVPVVPLSIYYYYNQASLKTTVSKVKLKFGKPIFVEEFDDLTEKLHLYEEEQCTMLYEIMEERGIYHRKTIDIDGEYASYLNFCLKNLKFGKINLDRERKYIFGSQADIYEFININKYQFDDDYIEKGLPDNIRYSRLCARNEIQVKS